MMKLSVATVLALLGLVLAAQAIKINEWPNRRTMSDDEAHFRQLLNIPPEATRVVILSQRCIHTAPSTVNLTYCPP